MGLHSPGDIPAEWAELLRNVPGYDPITTAGECRFDTDAASLALEFFDECVHHVKGETAGQCFGLQPWQRAVVANIYGWRRPDGSRRYREALIYVPRKNGKTTLAAGLVLVALFLDGEPGAEVYCAAADREQARLVFDVAKQMVEAEPALISRAKPYRSSINGPHNGTFKVLSADVKTKWGFNTHFAVIDELHAQPNRDLVEALGTSTSARRNPLVVHLTTADYDRVSICNEKYDYAKKVASGVVDDSAFLPVVYEAIREDDWTDPDVWAQANPNLGVSKSVEYMERECAKAQANPLAENTFKRLDLNLRTEQATRWFAMDAWDACGGALPDVTGERCFLGLDLATVEDVAALSAWFPRADEPDVLVTHYWVPEAKVAERLHHGDSSYDAWVRQGYMTATPGSVIDYDAIRQYVVDFAAQHDVVEVGLDPWNATQLGTQLAETHGLVVAMVRQGFGSMNEPSKEFQRRVMSAAFRHGGNPVLRWMASNVAIMTDPAGNIKPSKEHSGEKIDGITASIIALSRAMLDTGDEYTITFL